MANYLIEMLFEYADWKSHELFRKGLYRSYLENKRFFLFEIARARRICALMECWRREEAREEFERCLQRKGFVCNPHALRFCAQYFPEEVLACTEKYGTPLLTAALYERLGRHSEQKALLRSLSPEVWKKFPELHLYEGGWSGINAYLASFNLAACADETPWSFLPVVTPSSRRGPLVSIIMTVWNTREMVGRAITSVLGQTWQDWELIIVDDCSNDGSAEIVEAYVRQDARITYLKLEENVGTYHAKNKALKYCHGEFVTCLDSDDWSHPEKLERQVTSLVENEKATASVSYAIRMSEAGRPYAKAVSPLLRLNMSSLMFRRKIIHTLPFWEGWRVGADTELFYRIESLYGRRSIARVRIPLSLCMFRAESLTMSKSTGCYDRDSSLIRLNYLEDSHKKHELLKKSL